MLAFASPAEPAPGAGESPSLSGREAIDQLRGKIGEALAMGLDLSPTDHGVAQTVASLLSILAIGPSVAGSGE